LRTPPTTVQLNICLEIDDYWLEEWIKGGAQRLSGVMSC
jgi:hypothetical protein